jgi:hypothetical protein
MPAKAAISRRIKKGMGFKAAQAQIASKGGFSSERAGAILAASTRKASPAAKAKNPNLKKVKGTQK